MTVPLQETIRGIVRDAKLLVETHLNIGQLPVNYACVFAHSDEEYAEFETAAKAMGTVVQETTMGNVYRIPPLMTEAGELKVLKIRKPDPNRPERGDADFTLGERYAAFKQQHLGQPGWKLIERPEMEMLEFSHPDADVLAYFSYPTLPEVLRIP